MERRGITEQDIIGWKTSQENSEWRSELLHDLISRNSSQENDISPNDRRALWQFGRILLTHSKLERSQGRFLVMTIPCGFMEIGEEEVKLEWRIGREDYVSTLNILSTMAWRIYEGELVPQGLQQTAKSIVDFSKAYYAE